MTESNHKPRHTQSMQAVLLHIRDCLEPHTPTGKIVRGGPIPGEPGHALTDPLAHKQQLASLRSVLDGMHPADIARILAALPVAQRLQVWGMVKSAHGGAILVALPDAVREPVIANMDHQELVAAAIQLDVDQIAVLASALPQRVLRDVFKSLTIENRERLRAIMSYDKHSVGALMDFNMITIRDDVSLEVVSRYLRRFDALPDHTDQIFVVDRDDRLTGVLPLDRVIIHGPDVIVGAIMLTNMTRLHHEEQADQVVQAFHRYNLVSAAVVDEDGKLVGRVTVRAALEHARAVSANGLRTQAGLLKEEDIFATVWKSAKNRWVWLALNLCAAFFVSRVIGNFTGTIERFVALATLMPIVAGIAGHSANQTAAAIRSLTQDQFSRENTTRLLYKELALGGLNGLVWGGAAGLFAYSLYHNVTLGLVMMAAMLLSLLAGALFGLLIPMAMHKLGRDPATGSDVLLSAIIHGGGFFIFLGLATIFLIH
ncbi:MAG: magnesium transporter [Gallionella sp.]|nr:CBS domain-containing protein [Gallionella sp.]NNM80705.1 magnesium transporter [Gallionella sp.]